MHYFSFSRRCLAAIAVLCTLLAASSGWAQQASDQGNSAGGENSSSGAASAKSTLSVADQKAKEAYEISKIAASADEFGQIISLCDEALRQGATGDGATYARKLEAWAYNRRGEKYSETSDEKSALKDYDAAIALDAKLWKAVQNRGVSRAYLGDTKGAMADFDTVLQMNPKYANAWYNRGELKYDQGDINGAIADYDRAIQLQPGDAGFFNSRGHAHYRLGNFSQALSDYNRAVQINPDDAAALVNRGDAYCQQALYAAAASDYRDAIHTNPKLGRAYLSTAWLMATCPDQRYRDADKAIAAAKRAIELDGDKDYRYLDTLAAAQANAGNFDDAKATLSKAISKVPPKEMAHVRQRMELYQSGRAFRDGAPAEAVKPASANIRTQ